MAENTRIEPTGAAPADRPKDDSRKHLSRFFERFPPLVIMAGLLLLAMIVIAILVLAVGRKWVMATQTNRKLVFGLLAIVTGDLLVRLLGLHLELGLLETGAVESLFDFFGLLLVALLVDRRLLMAAAIFLVGAIVSIVHPPAYFSVIPWIHLSAFLSISVFWMRKDPHLD